MKNNNPSQPSLRSKGRSLKERNQAFTLVELIVVITILAILGTIAFLSFQGYSRDARDSVRISDLSNIHKQLELMLVKAGTVYMPENKVDITASGTVILYQGEMGLDTLNKLKVNNGGLDPIDQTPYTYSTTKNLKQYELMGFLENGNKVAYKTPPTLKGEGWGGVFPQANAAINLTNRFPTTKGDSIGIILDPTTNSPIQSTGTGVDIVNTNTSYKVYLDNSSSGSISGTGNTLFTKLYNKSPELLKNKDLAQLDSSLVLYFDMETTTLTGGYIKLKDLSRYHNDGICGTNWNYINCGSSTGLQFKNSNGKKYMNFTNSLTLDNVSVNDSPSLDISTNEVTISMWYRLNKNISDMNHPYPGFLEKRINNTGGYIAFIGKNYNNNIYMSYSFLNNSYYLGKNIFSKPNIWYFYTGVKTQNGLYLYNNGNLVDYMSVTQQMTESPREKLYIGTNFEGDIDEVRVYDRGLSAEEVMSLYNSSK